MRHKASGCILLEVQGMWGITNLYPLLWQQDKPQIHIGGMRNKETRGQCLKAVKKKVSQIVNSNVYSSDSGHVYKQAVWAHRYQQTSYSCTFLRSRLWISIMKTRADRQPCPKKTTDNILSSLLCYRLLRIPIFLGKGNTGCRKVLATYKQ